MIQILTPILLLVSACAARALTLTPEGATDYALLHNPQLAAARLRIEEAHGRLTASGRWANPEAEFDFRQNPRAPERAFGVAWMQKFPVTGRLRLEKAVSRAELAAAEAEVRDAGCRLAGEVRAAAVKLLALKQQRSLRTRQIKNSEELTSFMGKRLAVGEASNVDVAQIGLEAKQLATQVLQLDVERAVLLGQLRPLLGMSAGEPLEITGTLGEPGALPAKGSAPDARGDYRAAQATAEAARQAVDLAKANKWQDITAGVTAEHARTEDIPSGFKNDVMLGIKFSVPLPLWNKNEGKIREAAAAAQRHEKEVQALALQIASEATAARGEMAALARIIGDIDEKLIPQARSIEDQLRASYSTGLTTLAEVIRARGKRFELEAQRLDALRDYHLARARHATASGVMPGIKRK